jgi:hypothetical protein
MNDTGPHLGKSKQNLVGNNVSHVQTVEIIISMYISKPLQWKHLELSEKKIKKIKGLLKIESSDDVFTCPMN